MKVKIANKVYQMSKGKYLGLLGIASEQVPFGIYAIEKKDYAELRVDHCKSMSRLKTLKRQFKSQGFKVYANGGE